MPKSKKKSKKSDPSALDAASHPTPISSDPSDSKSTELDMESIFAQLKAAKSAAKNASPPKKPEPSPETCKKPKRIADDGFSDSRGISSKLIAFKVN